MDPWAQGCHLVLGHRHRARAMTPLEFHVFVSATLDELIDWWLVDWLTDDLNPWCITFGLIIVKTSMIQCFGKSGFQVPCWSHGSPWSPCEPPKNDGVSAVCWCGCEKHRCCLVYGWLVHVGFKIEGVFLLLQDAYIMILVVATKNSFLSQLLYTLSCWWTNIARWQFWHCIIPWKPL